MRGGQPESGFERERGEEGKEGGERWQPHDLLLSHCLTLLGGAEVVTLKGT